MANPKDILKKGIMHENREHDKEKYNETSECIKELISKAFATRNLLHFCHWDTGSFATHLAVGDLYDTVIEDIDDIVETFMGKYGKITGFSTGASEVPRDIISHIKDEAAWVEEHRSEIACGTTAIENLVDNLISSYHKTIYKLENLK